jgi:hypothetical protein
VRAGGQPPAATGARALEHGGAPSAEQMQKKVVHIVEEKVYAALDGEMEQESCRWVLDTGASNHMSGYRAAFSSIDGGTVGTVKFADGSVVRIEGIGMVIYECKTGEHRAFNGVYYIPRLNTSIISVGQLDEEGYEVLIKGESCHSGIQIRSCWEGSTAV